jgi:hypothetical protein
MKHPRLRLRRRLLAWLVLPCALWGLILALVPTEWARARLEGRLGQAIGKTVRLGAVRLGVLGEVHLRDLEIGESAALADPWLRVDDLRINLHLLNILSGQCVPTRVNAEGVNLRVHRNQDGSLEFGSLLASSNARSTSVRAQQPARLKGCSIEFVVQNGHLSLTDEPSQTRLEFHKIESQGTWDHRRAVIQKFRSELQGGEVELVAQLDRSSEPALFEGQLRAKGVALGDSMGALSYLIPVLSQASGAVDGRLDINLYVRGEGTTRAEIRRSLVGRGTVGVEPIRLDGSKVLTELASVVDLPNSTQLGSIHSQFTLANGRVISDQLTLNVGHVPFVLTGWTDFDGRLDYRVRHEGLTGKLSTEARSFLADLPIDLNDLMNLRVRGRLNDLVVTMDDPTRSSGSKENASRHADDRARLRELGRRLRDRILK